MELLCRRTKFFDNCTIGELSLNGEHLCYTLEDTAREVLGQPVSVWKIPGKTAIPIGRYRLTLEDSPRFGPNTMTLHNVPGFTGVRVHGGNTPDDTEGCPLLGFRIEGETIKGGTSGGAVEKVKRIVREANEETFWIVTQGA